MWLTALSIGRTVPWYVYVLVGAIAWGSWYKYQAAKAAELKREVAALEARAISVDRVQVAADTAVVASRARAVSARTAAAAGGRLRVRANVAAASAAGSCETAADTNRMFAELLGSVESEGRRMAEVADERGAAGSACQLALEALTEGKKGAK